MDNLRNETLEFDKLIKGFYSIKSQVIFRNIGNDPDIALAEGESLTQNASPCRLQDCCFHSGIR